MVCKAKKEHLFAVWFSLMFHWGVFFIYILCKPKSNTFCDMVNCFMRVGYLICYYVNLKRSPENNAVLLAN